MTIEERVREALRADAQRIEPPATPPLGRLTSPEPRPVTGRLVIAGAGLAGVVALLAAVLWWPSSLPSPGVDSIAGPVPPDPSAPHGLSFDPDGGQVFAEDEVGEDVVWRAAARYDEEFDHLDFDRLCVGVALEQDASSAGQRGSCVSEPSGFVVTRHEGQGEVVAIAGAVPSDAVRVVWELPEGDRELDLHQHPNIPQELFAAAAAVSGQPSFVKVYDADGTRLAAASVPALVDRQTGASPRYYLIADRLEEGLLSATLILTGEPTFDELRQAAVVAIGRLRDTVAYTALSIDLVDGSRTGDLGSVVDAPSPDRFREDPPEGDTDLARGWTFQPADALAFDLTPGNYDGFESYLRLREPDWGQRPSAEDVELDRALRSHMDQGVHKARQPDDQKLNDIRAQAHAQVADDYELPPARVEEAAVRLWQWPRHYEERVLRCRVGNGPTNDSECHPFPADR